MKNEHYMTDEQKEEATKLAGHLAIHYLNAVWDMSTSKKGFSSDYINDIQEQYNQVKKQVVTTYEKNLNDKILKFFMLKRKKKGEKITSNDILNIIKYKLYTTPKRKIACYMWDIPYDIYPYIRNVRNFSK